MKTVALAFLLVVMMPIAAQADVPDAATDWKKLYAAEQWYKDHPQTEQVFSGRLQRQQEAGASTLMRSHRYKLGDRFLYPGKEHPELEKLVGQKIEIRGKSYDVELEGQSVREIWPAAIRAAAPPATQPSTQPTTQTVAFDIHDGYFVSNKFEPQAPASYVVIQDQKSFEQVFGVGMVMGDKSHRLPNNAFESKMVVAAIRRGKAVWEFKVQKVTAEEGVLTIRYTATSTKSDSAEFACPLIVSLPRGNYAAIRFEENGKVVKQIELNQQVAP